MAVPGSALSRAEQSVECSLSHGAEPRAHGLPWPVPSRSSMQVASRRAPGLAQRQLGERVPAPAERRIWRPCVHRARPSGTSAAGGLDYHGARMALHPAAPTPPPSADRLMHSTRAQDAMEPRIDDFATKSEWRAGGFVGHVRNTFYRARGPRAVRSAIFGSKTGFRPLIVPKEPSRFGACLGTRSAGKSDLFVTMAKILRNVGFVPYLRC